jgi:molybdenum cofactor cytidylyltransferase
MGRPKQLLPWGGSTLIEWQIGQLRAAGASNVTVVLGSGAEALTGLVAAAGAEAIINERYREGRATSVRTGAEALAEGLRRIVIVSVDQPRPAWVTRRLLDAMGPGRLTAAPRHRGHGGHPIVLDGSLATELAAVTEETFGLRAVMERHKSETVNVEFENRCVIVDLNTPAEYQAALSSFERGEWDEDSRGPLQSDKGR